MHNLKLNTAGSGSLAARLAVVNRRQRRQSPACRPFLLARASRRKPSPSKSKRRSIAALADEDPLVRAADRWVTLRKFAPALLEAVDFMAARGSAPTLAAVEVLRELNRSGRRDVPADAPMPFKKESRALVTENGKIDRRLWETATMAHLRNKLRSGHVWVQRSTNYRRFDSYLLPTTEVAPIAADLA